MPAAARFGGATLEEAAVLGKERAGQGVDRTGSTEVEMGQGHAMPHPPSLFFFRLALFFILGLVALFAVVLGLLVGVNAEHGRRPAAGAGVVRQAVPLGVVVLVVILRVQGQAVGRLVESADLVHQVGGQGAPPGRAAGGSQRVSALIFYYLPSGG